MEVTQLLQQEGNIDVALLEKKIKETWEPLQGAEGWEKRISLNEKWVKIMMDNNKINLIIYCMENKHFLNPPTILCKWLKEHYCLIHKRWCNDDICACMQRSSYPW